MLLMLNICFLKYIVSYNILYIIYCTNGHPVSLKIESISLATIY